MKNKYAYNYAGLLKSKPACRFMNYFGSDSFRFRCRFSFTFSFSPFGKLNVSVLKLNSGCALCTIRW